MNQLISNLLMQRPTDAVELPERPLTLIEKLNDHKETIEVLRSTEKQGSHAFNFLGHHLLGLQTAIDIVKQHQDESDWVSVGERLPNEDEVVLAIGYGEVKLALYSDGVWQGLGYGQFMDFINVKFWQPMPKLPSEVQDD